MKIMLDCSPAKIMKYRERYGMDLWQLCTPLTQYARALGGNPMTDQTSGQESRFTRHVLRLLAVEYEGAAPAEVVSLIEKLRQQRYSIQGAYIHVPQFLAINEMQP